MSSERYHKAAKDGLLEVLKEATRKEANSKDADGMTPTLWAAFEGKIDALRLLVGRGGEPDKSDQFGNTALHLAAAKGHVQCVDFLVKFGVNVFALDIDHHSAKDLSAINNRDDILRYLDSAMSSLEIADRKKAKSMKDKAQKMSQKKADKYRERQQKMDQESEVMPMPHRPSTGLAALRQKLLRSGSQGNLNNQSIAPATRRDTLTSNSQSFSTLVRGTLSTGPRGAAQRKIQHAQRAKLMNQTGEEGDSDFKVGEVEPGGRRSTRSLHGIQRDSDVLFVGTFSSNSGTGKRGKITDIFEVAEMDPDVDDEDGTDGNLSRSISQPNFFGAANDEDEIREQVMLQRPSSIFDRPMLGELAFPRSVEAIISQYNPDNDQLETARDSTGKAPTAQTQKRINPRSHLVNSDSDSDKSSDESDDSEENTNPLERFLAAWGLDEYYSAFQKEKIDLDTLLLLNEGDLKALGLPVGPHRKLVIAVEERRNALSNPGPITDSRL